MTDDQQRAREHFEDWMLETYRCDLSRRGDVYLDHIAGTAWDAWTAALRTASEWQPIETAPRDGAPVWAFNGEQAPMLYIAGEGYALWIWADQVLADVDPSPEQPKHWKPLPSPPLATRPQGVM